MDARRKGARGELELAGLYAKRGWSEIRRTPNSGGLWIPGDLTGGPTGLHIEVKRVEKLNIWRAMAQSVSDAPAGTVPTVHYRRNREDWWVTLPLEAFFGLIGPPQLALFEAAA